MLDRIHASVTDRLGALARQLLARRGMDREPARDEDLGESGLTSLDIVNLMLAVEAEFEVKIPDRDMTPANFRTVARIEALLGTLLENPDAA